MADTSSTLRRVQRGVAARARARLVPTVRRLSWLSSKLAGQGDRALVLGDSHARVFKTVWADQLEGATAPRVVAVSGATLHGLGNPFSRTRARQIFVDELDAAPAGTDVILLLGEVDCGYLMWIRQKELGLRLEEQTSALLNNYEELLTYATARGHRPLVVAPPPPTLEDYTGPGEVIQQRRAVTASRAARTELTVTFSEELARVCRRLGVDFYSPMSQLLNAQGILRAEFVNADPGDHHLDVDRYAAVLAEPVAAWLRAGQT